MKKRKGFMLLESVVSMLILSMIALVALSVIINTYRYTSKSKLKSHMLNKAKNIIENIKVNEYEYVKDNYEGKIVNDNGFEITTYIEDENLNNCKKITVSVKKENNNIKLSTYKVTR